jgi:hypothetical protein
MEVVAPPWSIAQQQVVGIQKGELKKIRRNGRGRVILRRGEDRFMGRQFHAISLDFSMIRLGLVGSA